MCIRDRDPGLIALAQRALEQMPQRKYQYKLGRIATGDIFVDDEALRRSIIERTHPDCVEMEGAAIALVAYSNQIPCLVIRSMSDNANGDAGMSLDVYKRQVQKLCQRLSCRCDPVFRFQSLSLIHI